MREYSLAWPDLTRGALVDWHRGYAMDADDAHKRVGNVIEHIRVSVEWAYSVYGCDEGGQTVGQAV